MKKLLQSIKSKFNGFLQRVSAVPFFQKKSLEREINECELDFMLYDIDKINDFFKRVNLEYDQQKDSGLDEIIDRVDSIQEYFKRLNLEYDQQRDKKLDEIIDRVNGIQAYFSEFTDNNPFEFKHTEYVAISEMF